MSLTGVLHFHSETGTEGGYWAFQDEKFITTVGKYPQWSYDGLHVLKDGDRLTIRYPAGHPQAGQVAWQGVIELHKHALFTEDAGGMWIHADQVNMDREEWARMFFQEYPAELDLA